MLMLCEKNRTENGGVVGINLTEDEKIWCNIIQSNLEAYNAHKRKGLLAVSLYVDGGNKMDILLYGRANTKPRFLLAGVTLREGMYALATLCNYNRLMT